MANPPPQSPLLPSLNNRNYIIDFPPISFHQQLIMRHLDSGAADYLALPASTVADVEDWMSHTLIINEGFIATPPKRDGGLPEEAIARLLKTEAAAEAEGGDHEVCAVCLDDLHVENRTVGVISCCHRFHGDCIGEWLRKKNACPLCRASAL